MTRRLARVALAVALLLLLLVRCGGAPTSEPAARAPGSQAFVLTHARGLGGDARELFVVAGAISTRDTAPGDAPELDAEGSVVIPAFVDAHVHLSYFDVAERHADGGIAVAIDLASPIEALRSGLPDPLLVLRAGPMITSPGGYPLDSWGSHGFGIVCTDAVSCAERVELLVGRGAALLKVPVEERGGLDDASLSAICERAHALDHIVVAHALSDVAARRAAAAGVDVLAHTPTTPLSEETLVALRGRAVISTLAAFGGGPTAIENLRRLRAGGVTILYGTDLGNSRTIGIDPRELALLVAAGLDAAAIVEAATAAPARVFHLERHGTLAPGRAASFLLYRGDVVADPTALAQPDRVVLDGVVR